MVESHREHSPKKMSEAPARPINRQLPANEMMTPTSPFPGQRAARPMDHQPGIRRLSSQASSLSLIVF
jgi:hypothetical protein